jgi:sugar (pentulose or hexulose) kinase
LINLILLPTPIAQISDQIFTVGGGGKSDFLSQLRATVMNKQVVTMANSDSDIGAALLAYATTITEDLDLAAALDHVLIAQTKQFNPQKINKMLLSVIIKNF